MEPNDDQSKRQKGEEIDLAESRKTLKQEELPEKAQNGIWFVNKDIGTCLEKSAPIVTYSGHIDYFFAPLTEGYKNNAFSLSMKNEQTTVLLAKCNGLIFGRFINAPTPDKPKPPSTPSKRSGKDWENYQARKAYYDTTSKPLYYKLLQKVTRYEHDCGETGSHAEDAFINAWRTAEKAGAIKQLRAIHDGKAFVTLKLSRSPCSQCTKKLIKLVNSTAQLKLRIKVQTLYEGEGGVSEGASNVCLLIDNGIAVREWNVPFYAKKHNKGGVTKLKQIHELHAWASDIDDEFHGLLLKQADDAFGRDCLLDRAIALGARLCLEWSQQFASGGVLRDEVYHSGRLLPGAKSQGRADLVEEWIQLR